MNECPFCLADVAKPDEGAVCGSCGAVYHSECWAASGGCCAKGCQSARTAIELDVARGEGDRIAISREAAENAVSHSRKRDWTPCLRCGRHVSDGRLYCADCAPEKEAGQDTRNVGPLLLMLALVALVLATFVVLGKVTEDSREPVSPQGVNSVLRK